MSSEWRELDKRLSVEENRGRRISPMGYPAGDAFPTGIPDGYLFYRTDAQQLCRYDSASARWYPEEGYGAAIARHLALPALRAFWPLTAYNSANGPLDMSGNTMSLTNNNGSAGLYGRALYWNFNGTNAYLSRADEANLDLTSSFTMGGWFYFNTLPAASVAMGKWNTATNQRSYLIQTESNDVKAYISTTGADNFGSGAAPITLATGTWYHIVARFHGAIEMTIFVNGQKTSNTSSVPASAFSGSGSFTIGAAADPFRYMNGFAALCFMLATGQSGCPDSVITDLYQKTKLWFY